MIRATLDANVLVSGFVGTRGAPTVILERWADEQFTLVLSEHILSGTERAWRKPYFAARYPVARVNHTLTLLRTRAVMVIPTIAFLGMAEDAEDDLVLGTAVAGGVDYLVTGDKHLQGLGAFSSVASPAQAVAPIAIVSPRQFLEFLERSGAPSQSSRR